MRTVRTVPFFNYFWGLFWFLPAFVVFWVGLSVTRPDRNDFIHLKGFPTDIEFSQGTDHAWQSVSFSLDGYRLTYSKEDVGYEKIANAIETEEISAIVTEKKMLLSRPGDAQIWEVRIRGRKVVSRKNSFQRQDSDKFFLYLGAGVVFVIACGPAYGLFRDIREARRERRDLDAESK